MRIANWRCEINWCIMENIQSVYESFGEPSARGDYHIKFSQLLYDICNFAKAMDQAHLAHTIFQSVADPVGMGDALIDLGLAAQRIGDID